DVLTIGVVVDLARALVADALARAVGRSPRDAAAFSPREDLDVQKILCHRAVRRRAAPRRHGCPNRAKPQIVPASCAAAQDHPRTWREIHLTTPIRPARNCANGLMSPPALAAELQLASHSRAPSHSRADTVSRTHYQGTGVSLRRTALSRREPDLSGGLRAS